MPAPSFRTSVRTPAAWVVVGACWVAQLLVPWTTSGAFASSSLVDGVRLVGSGRVDAVVPSWAAPVALVLPAAGLALVALSTLDGRAAALVRTVAAVAGVLLVVATAAVLAGLDPQRLGPGGWTALGGAVMAIAAALLDRDSLRSPLTPHHRKVSP